jgi:hypothetical protein
MSSTSDHQAWNNFVMHSDPTLRGIDGAMRAAALANLYMGAANNGGINSFLTASHDFGSQIVLDALREVGALHAAQQLAGILTKLGTPLPTSSEVERWQILKRLWTEDMDEHDVLTSEADAELMRVLERHVSENESYYLTLSG